MGGDALRAWRSPTQASGGGDREEWIDPEEAESKEFSDLVPQGDKGGSKTSTDFDFELLDGFTMSLMRQTHRKVISAWPFRASGFTTCGQRALSE